MRKVDLEQKLIVIDILTRAFDKNKSVNYVVMQGPHREARIRRLMEYSFDVCLAFGEIWLTDDRCGCALILFPDQMRTSIRTILWDIKLVFSVIGLHRVGAVMRREGKVKSFHPKEPFSYLWFIGVCPTNQHAGIGSALLKDIIEMYEGRSRPTYLETSVEQNLGWYKKFGFEIFQTLQLRYTLYLLRRTTRK